MILYIVVDLEAQTENLLFHRIVHLTLATSAPQYLWSSPLFTKVIAYLLTCVGVSGLVVRASDS